MVSSVSILGSTGSIGGQTVRVCEALGIPVFALAANRDVDAVERQVMNLGARCAVMYDEDAASELSARLAGTGVEVRSGMDGLVFAAAGSGADCVVTAVSGSVGLLPTLAAIDAGKRVALANKETLVCAGELVTERARLKNAEIIPVDSEHSAIFQCLEGRREQLRTVLLTGSGGPFRGMTREQTERVTPEQAVKHPNWSMGAKISVDSATLMNKGLEFIEAMHLFSVRPDDIRVVIHPESVIHSMVELRDGSVLAQLGVPDMALPIQYALTYPERRESDVRRLDFTALSGLRFEAPDLEKTPCLRLAMDCAAAGGTAPAILSAANEEAVGLFLGHRIGYNEIYDAVRSALDAIGTQRADSVEAITEADCAARIHVRERFS